MRYFVAVVLMLSTVWVEAAAQSAPPPPPSYYVRAYQHGSYVIEYDGRQLATTCRETLSWLDGTNKLGGPMAEHDCTYMQGLVGKHIGPELMWRRDKELRYQPWSGQDTTQTADILDITAEAPIGSPLPKPSPPKTSPEILKTLHWIQNTLADEEGKTIYLHEDGKDNTRVNLLPDVNGCQVTFVYSTRSHWKETYHARQQVNLEDLDPTSLEVNTAVTNDVLGPVSLVTVHTTDKVPAVHETFNDRNWNGSWTATATDLLWQLPAPYAARFAKALRQAITLCGGKASAF
jgi:hypothetical protein